MSVSARTLRLVPVALRELAVGRVVDVTSGMKRITLTGSQLGEFTSPGEICNQLSPHRGSMTIFVCCFPIQVRVSRSCL